MKTQHVFVAVVVALFVAPVVLSVGTFFLIPLVLLLLALLPGLVVIGLSTLFVSGARATVPAAARVHTLLPTTIVCPR
jgi:uncharacterized membrane protein YqaE (UPF0057 family)